VVGRRGGGVAVGATAAFPAGDAAGDALPVAAGLTEALDSAFEPWRAE
jgi:hypothetical protein